MAYRKGDRIVSYTGSFLPFVLVYQFCLFLVRLIDWLVLGFEVKGRENLQSVNPAVLVSNHTLVIDPGVIAHAIRPRRTYFTMLEETALVPYLGTFVRLLGGLPIPPESIRRLEDAVVRGIEETGFVHFFPEGECYLWNQRIRPLAPGAFYVACRLQIPVIPITTVLHKRRLFGRSSFSIFGRTMRVPPRVSVVVCKPLYPEQFLVHAPHPGSTLSMPLLDPSSNRNKTILKAARAMSESARLQMQEAIDRERGSKTLYRGVMPRLAKQKEPA